MVNKRVEIDPIAYAEFQRAAARQGETVEEFLGRAAGITAVIDQELLDHTGKRVLIEHKGGRFSEVDFKPLNASEVVS